MTEYIEVEAHERNGVAVKSHVRRKDGAPMTEQDWDNYYSQNGIDPLSSFSKEEEERAPETPSEFATAVKNETDPEKLRKLVTDAGYRNVSVELVRNLGKNKNADGNTLMLAFYNASASRIGNRVSEDFADVIRPIYRNKNLDEGSKAQMLSSHPSLSSAWSSEAQGRAAFRKVNKLFEKNPDALKKTFQFREQYGLGTDLKIHVNKHDLAKERLNYGAAVVRAYTLLNDADTDNYFYHYDQARGVINRRSRAS